MSTEQTLGYVEQPAKKCPVLYDVDVAVAGSGLCGTFAAIAAARRGAKTLVIDRFGALGGNIGPGMIMGGGLDNEAAYTLPGGLAGIPREFMTRLKALSTAHDYNYDGPSGILTDYAEDSNIASYLAFKMAEEAGVHLLLSAYAADPIIEEGRVRGLFVETKSGRVAVRAKVVVDATGDADLARRAGAPVICRVPPKPGYASLIRPPYLHEDYAYWNSAGILVVIAGVDFERYEEFRSAEVTLTPEDQAWAEANPNRAAKLPGPLIPDLRKAWESGRPPWQEIPCGKVNLSVVSGFRNLGNGLAASRVQAFGEIDSADAIQVTTLERALRTFAFDAVRFLQTHAPGLESVRIIATSPFMGTRGGPYIEGEYTLTVEDAFVGRKADDVLFRNIHEGTHGGEESGYDVCYRMLLPKGVDGLMVIGRGTAYVRRGHDPTGLRARPSMMTLGQAAGTAAAVAALDGVTPKRVDIKKVQRKLVADGIFLGDDARLAELGLK